MTKARAAAGNRFDDGRRLVTLGGAYLDAGPLQGAARENRRRREVRRRGQYNLPRAIIPKISPAGAQA